jgi:hypothetical protein
LLIPELDPLLIAARFIESGKVSLSGAKLSRTLETTLFLLQADSTAPEPIGQPRQAIS